MIYDTIIKNGLIYDGTGKAPYRGDIGIVNGKIAAIGKIEKISEMENTEVIDASGFSVTPGFIDMHSHADCSVPMWPDMENLLAQGITTVFAGHCGFGLAPVTKYWLEMDFDQAAMNQMMPQFSGGAIPDPQRAVKTEEFAPIFEQTYGESLDWGDYKGYVEHLRRVGIGCNLSANVGQHQLRQEAMGFSVNRAATETELQEMERLLTEAMEDGAWGFSIGLDYKPGAYANQEELLRLMRIASCYHGVVTAHVQLRNFREGKIQEGHLPIDGYREFLELGRKAGVHVHISHILNGWYGYIKPEEAEKTTKDTIALIREYQKKGLEVTWDILPWSNIAIFHYPQLANWLRPYVDRCGGIHAFADTVKHTNYGELIADEINQGNSLSRSVFSRIDPLQNPNWADSLCIASCKNSDYIGKKIPELAEQFQTDLVRTVIRLVSEDPETKITRSRKMDPDSYYVFEQEEDVTFGTDNAAINYGVCYREQPDFPYDESTPSAFSNMIRVIEDSRIQPFEKLIYHLTGCAAKAAGYQDRGTLEVGKAADILILDREHLASHYNEVEPQTKPDGIRRVLVNGKTAYADKKFTHIRSGQVLLRKKEMLS